MIPSFLSMQSAVSRLTPSPGAVQSLALWGTTAGVGALWLVQVIQAYLGSDDGLQGLVGAFALVFR